MTMQQEQVLEAEGTVQLPELTAEIAGGGLRKYAAFQDDIAVEVNREVFADGRRFEYAVHRQRGPDRNTMQSPPVYAGSIVMASFFTPAA